MGRMYAATFSEVAVTAAQDFFQLEAVTVPIVVHGAYISQQTDYGDAAAEGLPIKVRRFTDLVTDDVNAVVLDSGDGAENAKIAINETTQLVTGEAVIHSEAWNIQIPFVYLPTPELRPTVKVGDGFAVSLEAAPTDSITCSGTLYFEEIGS